MPIQVEISHFDRVVVGIGRGGVTLQEYGQFIGDLIQQGVVHYRKIIDVTSAVPINMNRDVLLAVEARLREYTKTRRGPLAIVANRDQGEAAQAFKVLTSEERPVEVFRSIHDARAWVARFPVEESIIKPAEEK